MKQAAAAAIGLFLSACALQRATLPAGELHSADRLRVVGGRYVLERPLADYYDTVLVAAHDGPSAPRPVTLAQAADRLAGADVVFYGESHDHAGVHLEQMRLFRELYQRDPHWILSMEHFERDTQGVLDDYLAARIGEATLIDKGHAWNNYAASYRPLVLFAKEHHLPVVAAEAPGWAISCVGQWGIDILGQFTPLERSWVAADVHDLPGPYRDKFLEFLRTSPAHATGTSSTPGTSATPGAPVPSVPSGADAAARAQRSFSAQAARDDTMAESIAHALRAHPGYRVLHLTGSFHSAEFLGTVERLRLRAPQLKIAVISPVEVDDPAAPSFAAAALTAGTFLQLIYPDPEDYVEGEDTSALMAKMAHAHAANRCKYSLPPAAQTSPPPPTVE